MSSSSLPPTSPDPWGRPQLSEVHSMHFEDTNDTHIKRAAMRLELTVPTTVTVGRGNQVPGLTRNISRYGICVVLCGHGSPMPEDEVIVSMSSDSREYKYRVLVKWVRREADKMLFGGKFLSKIEDNADF